ncbi:hypothetical protein [Streptomyces tauricus]
MTKTPEPWRDCTSPAQASARSASRTVERQTPRNLARVVSPAVACAECRVDGAVCWGAGRDTSVLTVSVHAVMAAVNRAGRAGA